MSNKKTKAVKVHIRSLTSQMELTNAAMDFPKIVEIVNEEQSRNRSVGRRKVFKFVVVAFFLSVIPEHRLKF